MPTREKLREYDRRYRARHPERIRERQKASYWADLEKSRAKNRESYAKHAEARRAVGLKRYYENREARLAKARLWKLNNREKYLASKKRWNQKNIEKILLANKIASRKTKAKVFDHYGRICMCCGENHVEFLSIDHMNGGGTKHRKEIGGGSRFYPWLVKNDFPDGFQTLCMNCNFAKGHFSKCPHSE